MIGYYDNSQRQFSPAKTVAIKAPFHTRVRSRLRGRRPMLYMNAGLHLRLPKPHDDIVYVYIRKNGCSAFKQWLLHDMGDLRGPEVDISIVAQRYAISMEWELAQSRRLLVLRDPIERMCSLYRNKFVQRKSAEDILRSFAETTGIHGSQASFKFFVKNYLQLLTTKRSLRQTKIDPHCLPQVSCLWPIKYDYVVMLDDLTEVSKKIFSEGISDKYFSHRVNSTPTKKFLKSEAVTPASLLIKRYKESGELPDNDSLLDDQLRDIIAEVYEADYNLINFSFI